MDLDTLKAGTKGKAVNVLHTWRDHLFDMGNRGDPPDEIEVDVSKDDDAPNSEVAGAEEGQHSAPGDVANDPSRTNSAASLAPASAPKISTFAPSEPALSKEGKICLFGTVPRLTT